MSNSPVAQPEHEALTAILQQSNFYFDSMRLVEKRGGVILTGKEAVC